MNIEAIGFGWYEVTCPKKGRGWFRSMTECWIWLNKGH